LEESQIRRSAMPPPSLRPEQVGKLLMLVN